jgi:hypothetical protein
MPHIRTDNQPVTQITVIEPEPGKQAEALYIQWQSRDLLRSAHKSPEFRREWDHFDQLTDEIDPHLYEVSPHHGQ